MKMGNTSIEEHVAKFKMLVTKSKLEKNEAVVEYFRETLPIPLQKNIMTLEKHPTTLNEWYKWAIKLQNNFVRMKSAIAKSQNLGGNAPPTPNKKLNEKGSILMQARRIQMIWTLMQCRWRNKQPL